jgi:phage terminase large subunit-like protein
LTPVLARGVTDAYDTIQVKHYRSDGTPDGVSTLTFKSYEQGQKKHQGEPIDFDWCDEEPPEDVYSEILTRTTATDGMVMVTFTPLQGRSNVVTKYMDEPADSRAYIVMTIEDAEHIPAEKRAAIIAAWPAHERDARARGIPMMGSGAHLPVPARGDHRAADPPYPGLLGQGLGDRLRDQPPLRREPHAVGQGQRCHPRPRDDPHGGRPAPPARPAHAHAGRGSPRVLAAGRHPALQGRHGRALAAAYRKHKLLMHHEHATWPDGGLSTEAAVIEMQERITTGRFKVASHLADWLHEYDMYHRKDGQIVKVNDDLISATQKGLMMKRFFRAVALGEKRTVRRRDEGQARDVDFDLF